MGKLICFRFIKLLLAQGFACLVFIITIPTLAYADSDSVAEDIRKSCGVSNETLHGDIQIVDVGHGPLDTMLSIVANRSGGGGWDVSYVCGKSPFCKKNDGVCDVRDYRLSPDQGTALDNILASPEMSAEPLDAPQNQYAICGWLAAKITTNNGIKIYRRSCKWGNTLGKIESILLQKD